jgi:non-specific serine/threonine protein kinase
MSSTTAPTAAPATSPIRVFGRFQLRHLLGKSLVSMAWLAFDPRSQQEVMLTLPRHQPTSTAALDNWLRDVRQASRLSHPHLAAAAEVGEHERWPYVAVDRAIGITLGEWLAGKSLPPLLDTTGMLCQLLDGLAFAHEAGVAHNDIQLHSVIVGEQGVVRLMGLHVANEWVQAAAAPGAPAPVRRQQREHAERDVLSVGLLLHRVVSGQLVLDEVDIGKVIQRMPPQGHEVVRLPWGLPLPVAEPLRAIANRATASHDRQRYLSARTLARALSGWREVEANGAGGALVLLLDRLRSVGHLPASPTVGARMGRLGGMENQRTEEIAENILQDMALSFELLRQVNSAAGNVAHLGGGGPVLTVRRAIAMMGLEGVKRAAHTLRPWPGPLKEAGAAALTRALERARLAGHTAQMLRPPGFDPEVVYLVTALQNLGRLLVQYHFPDEAEQVRALMQGSEAAHGSPVAGAPAAGADAQPSAHAMSEEAASFAVLGVGTEVLGAAVAKHWGLGDEMQHMMHRLPVDRPVRVPENDADMLRLVGSAANEAVDALSFNAATRIPHAVTAVATRYARTLEIVPKDLMEALRMAREALRSGQRVADAAPAVPPAARAAAAQAAPPAPTPPASAETASERSNTPGALSEMLRHRRAPPPPSGTPG